MLFYHWITSLSTTFFATASPDTVYCSVSCKNIISGYIPKTALFIRSDMCYNGPEQKRPASGGLPGETPDHTKRKK
jgi:hypothetical protein